MEGWGSFRIPGKQSMLGKNVSRHFKKKTMCLQEAALPKRSYKRRPLLLGKDPMKMFEKSDTLSLSIELCRLILALLSNRTRVVQVHCLHSGTRTVSSALSCLHITFTALNPHTEDTVLGNMLMVLNVQ